MIANKRYWF